MRQHRNGGRRTAHLGAVAAVALGVVAGATGTITASAAGRTPTAATTPADCELAQGVSDDEIVFGTSQPLSGQLAVLGNSAVAALEAWAETVNDGGGIHGRSIRIVAQDDEYSPESAVANAQFLTDREQVFAVLGSTGSATSSAAMPVVTEAGVPFLFPYALGTDITDPVNPLAFSVATPAFFQTQALSDYFADGAPFDDMQVGLLTINSPDGVSTVEGFKAGAGADLLVAEQTYERESASFVPQLLAFDDAGVTDLYFGGADTQFAKILQEADESGLEFRVWGSSGTVTNTPFELTPDLVEGQYASHFLTLPTSDLPGPTAYRDALAAHDEGATPDTTGLLAWVGAVVTEQALRDAGPCLTVDAFVGAMEALTEFDVGGSMPPISFSPDNHLGNQDVLIFQAQDGEWVQIDP